MVSKKKIYKQVINQINNTLININCPTELEQYINCLNNIDNENTISCIIKKYCDFNKLDKIDYYLNYLTLSNLNHKLRIYSPIIDLYYRTNNLCEIIKLYEKTRQHNIMLSDIDFSKILYVLITQKSAYYNKLLLDIINYINILDSNSYIILKNIVEESNNIKLNKIDIDLDLKNNILDFIYINEIKKNSNFKEFIQILDNKRLKSNIVILDGANIGFYNNRPDKGNKISINQINNVVNYYMEKNYEVLIILHNRHLKYNKFNCNENIIIDNLKKKKILYQTPDKLNDDLYWLYATIYLSKFTNCYLITNDKLRDHIFSIILKNITKFDNKIISYFKDNYIINYEFDFKNKFLPAVIKNYTCCIQKIQIDNNLCWILPIKFDKIIFYKII